MRVDGCIAAVDEEAQLAEAAAVADEFIDVGMCHRRTGTLECEVCQMTTESVLYCSGQSFNALCDP